MDVVVHEPSSNSDLSTMINLIFVSVTPDLSGWLAGVDSISHAYQNQASLSLMMTEIGSAAAAAVTEAGISDSRKEAARKAAPRFV
jgi:hypothetical protein